MSPWIVPNLVAALLVTGIFTVVLLRRPLPPLWPVVPVACGATLLFAWADVLSVAVRVGRIGDWLVMACLYTGMCVLAPSWWILALRFGEARRIPVAWDRRPIARLPAWAAAVLWPVMATNPWHGLFITVNPGNRSTYHALWYLFALTSHGVILAALSLFLRHAVRARDGETRGQALVLSAATALPAAGNAIYVLTPQPLPFDPTTIGLSLSCAFLLVAIRRQHLFGLSPVALTSVMGHDPNGVLILDASHRLLYANPAAASLLGESPSPPGSDALPALSAVLRDPKDDAPLSEGALRALIESPAQPPDGHALRVADAAPRSIRLLVTTVPGPRGRVAGRCLRIRDRTALEAATEAAASQAAVLEAMLSSSDEGILVVEPRGRIAFVNETYLRTWSVRDVALVGQEAVESAQLEASRVADPERYWARLRHVVASPDLEAVDELPLADGRILERTTRPFQRGGSPAGRVWRFRDVTRRRRLEETLRRSRELESLVVLTGGIAHDFNNLLAALMANIDLAMSELPEDSPAAPYLQAADRSVDRAAELTRQLLAHAGQPGGALERIDLSLAAREAQQLLPSSIPPGIRIEERLAAALPPVECGPAQARRIIGNLLLNAIEAMEDRDGSVLVETFECSLTDDDLARLECPATVRPGAFVAVAVQDEGSGIDPATRPRIFHPFFTTKPGASGLGLAAVAGIVRNRRGAIGVESDLGTRVTVYLPSQGAE